MALESVVEVEKPEIVASESPESLPAQVKIQRPKRAVLTRDEVLRRMETLETERKEEFIAAVRFSRSTIEKTKS